MKLHLQKTKTLFLVLISVLLVTSFKAQCTFGNFPATYTAPGNFGANYLLGTKFNLPITATLTGLGYKGNGTGSGMQMAIYTDAGNVAGTLVAVTSLTTNSAGNITLTVPTTVIPAGDYWIMANYQVTGLNQVCYTTASTKTVCYISLPYGNAPPVSTSWTTYTGQDFNYWAVLAGTLPTVSINSSTTTICSGNTVSLTANGATSYSWNTSSTNTTITQNPTVTTTYSVIGTNTTGCFNTAVQTITVNTAIANAGSTKTITCAVPNPTLTGSGLSTYTWSGPGIVSGGNTANPVISSPGVYSLTGSNGGCASNTATVMVNTNFTAPSVNIFATNFTVCAGSSSTLTANGASSYTWSTGTNSTSIIVTPSVSTNYTVTGVHPTSGCPGSATQFITVNSLPSITVSNNSVTVCSGNMGCLYANAGPGAAYMWAGPCGFSSTSQNPCFPYSMFCPCGYTVFVTGANGCSNTATICLNVNPVPSVTATTSNSLICIGQTATLTAAGAATYSWNTSSTNTAIAVSPTVNTTYTVTGTNSSGCTNSVSITQTVSGCIGVNELPANFAEPVLFPNPTTGIVTITSGSIANEAWMEVYNSIGEQILREKNVSNQTVLNLSEQPAGIYFIKLISDGSASHFRIIKQ